MADVTPMTLRLPSEHHEALSALAAKRGTSIADLVRGAVAELVASRCPKCQGTGKA